MVPDSNMSQERRRLLRTLGATAGAGILAGCMGGDDNTGSDGSTPADDDSSGESILGGEILAGIEGDIGGLDPHTMVEDTSWRVNHNLYEGVLRRGPQLDMEPILAENWEISDDGMTYTFDLREGVMFHPPEDREMVADDVVYSWERISDPEVSARAGFWDPAGDIYAEDDYTVVIEMDEPSTPFQFNLNEMIMARDAPEKYNLNEVSVGTGPFMFDEYGEGDFIRITPHENYWGEDDDGNQLPYVDQVEFTVTPEGATRATSIRTGEIDALFQVPMAQVDSIGAEDDVTTHSIPGITFDYITFDMRKDVLSDRTFREAVAWTIDREDMTTAGHFGYATPTHTPVNPETELGQAIEIDEDRLHHQDFDRAQELIEESDYDGENFEILCVAGFDHHVAMAEVLNDNLREIGVETTINSLEQEAVFDRGLFDPHDFEILVMSWGGIIDPNMHLSINVRTGEGLNQPGYGDEELDELINAGAQAVQVEERADIYEDVFDRLLEDLPYIYLDWHETTAAVRSRLNGYTPFPYSAGALKFRDVWLDD